MHYRLLLPATFITSLVFVACGQGSSRPGSTTMPSPNPSPGPSSRSVPPFSVTGTVTEARVGPLPGAMVVARPNFPPGNGSKVTTTNDAGQYRIDGLTEDIIIDVHKDGFFDTGYGAFIGDRTLDFVLHRLLRMDAGTTLKAAIWGSDDFWDEELANRCHTPQVCTMIEIVTPGPGTLTATFRPVNPVYPLTFFVHVPGPCCQKGYGPEDPLTGVGALTVSAPVPFPMTVWAVVQFINVPPPGASQEFDLMTQFAAQ
jgi:hypothetical protein